jgi:hypothetical protein
MKTVGSKNLRGEFSLILLNLKCKIQTRVHTKNPVQNEKGNLALKTHTISWVTLASHILTSSCPFLQIKIKKIVNYQNQR